MPLMLPIGIPPHAVPKTRTPGVLLGCILLALAGKAPAQEGFAADRLMLDLAGDGLWATHGPGGPAGRLTLGIGIGWSHHLLGIEQANQESIDWVVDDRLSLVFGVAYSPWNFLQVEGGFDAAPYQRGLRTDNWGAPVTLQACLGRSWLTAVFTAPWFPDGPLRVALAGTLLLPSAPLAGLASPRNVQGQVELRLSTGLWRFHPMINFGVETGSIIRFQNLDRGHLFTYRGGTSLDVPEWLLSFSLEVAGETLLASAADRGASNLLELIVGARVFLGAGFEVQVGAGVGMLGALAPAGRAMVLGRWTWAGKK